MHCLPCAFFPLIRAALTAPTRSPQTHRLLLSEAWVVRGRALVGMQAGGAGAHWSEYTGRQRLSAVLARMDLGGTEEQVALEAGLLPTGS